MDYEQLLVTALLSGITSYLVAFFNIQKQKKLEFTYDYRKELLSKRKYAYEHVEKIISFNNSNYYTHREEIVKGLTDEETMTNNYHNFHNLVLAALHHNLWMSNEMFDVLIETEHSIRQLKDEVDFINATFLRSELARLGRELQVVYFRDFTRLDDIDFFKNKKIVEY